MGYYVQGFALLLMALVTAGLTISVYLLWRDRRLTALRQVMTPSAGRQEERLSQLQKALEEWLGQYREQTQAQLGRLETEVGQLRDLVETLSQPPAPAQSPQCHPQPELSSLSNIVPELQPAIKPESAGLSAHAQILCLHREGVPEADIARQVNVSRQEVQMVIGLAHQQAAPA